MDAFKRRLKGSAHFAPLTLLFGLAFVFWSRVLVTEQVLLPGAMLRGFAPFGGDPQAPWTILQWDSLAQYFPWRHFAARQLSAGHIPLWNPFQFTGTPFVANAQSAVFYPLNLPFWFLDTGYAFGVSAWLHTLLGLGGTYFLARRWELGRVGAVTAAISYGFCGYLAEWALLPTLAATAAWLPLCLLTLEMATDDKFPRLAFPCLVLGLNCALLAGHAQIFLYLIMALAIRIPFLRRSWRGLWLMTGALLLSLALGALQLLPTLELARLGHRAAGGPSAAGWHFLQLRALSPQELTALFIPDFPLPNWGSLNENFGYVGTGCLLLGLAGIFALKKRGGLAPTALARANWFALTLAGFGLLYAMATPLAQLIYFCVPGVAMMGGTGRALVLWSLGWALLVGFGLDGLRRRVPGPALPLIAILWVAGELTANAWINQPTAPDSAIYPATTLTSWLKSHSSPRDRVLFYTPKKLWLPHEALAERGRNHPPGVLPPNGAMVYGIYDVNGYDSLAPRAYRAWIEGEEQNGVSPPLNGNMVLLNTLDSPALLDSLAVRYVVTPAEIVFSRPPGRPVLAANGCTVWRREDTGAAVAANGAAFYPGWHDGVFQPQSFRLGLFISLATLGFLSAWVLAYSVSDRRN